MTGLIFTRSQADWPSLAKQKRVFHTMCCDAGFWLEGAGRQEGSRASGAGGSLGGESGSVPSAVCFVYFPYLYLYVFPYLGVVTVPFVCCSVKLFLSQATSFCLFLSILSPTPVEGGAVEWPCGPFVAGHGQTITITPSKTFCPTLVALIYSERIR